MVNWQGYGRKHSQPNSRYFFRDFHVFEFSKNHETTPGNAGEPVEFRANDLPNVSEQRYLWTSRNCGTSTCLTTDARCTVLFPVDAKDKRRKAKCGRALWGPQSADRPASTVHPIQHATHNSAVQLRYHTAKLLSSASANTIKVPCVQLSCPLLTLPLTVRSYYLHMSVMELGFLLTHSGLTYLEVSSEVWHDSFCQLGNSVSLSWAVCREAFCLHVVSSSSCIPVVCLEPVLFQ